LSSTDQIFETTPALLLLERRWFEVLGRLERGELPKLTIRYARQEREGGKDATIWGEDSATSSGRGVVPSIYNLDEVRNTIEVTSSKSFEATTVELGYRYDEIKTGNDLLISRAPDEVANTRKITEQKGSRSEISTVKGFLGYRFNDTIRLTTGASLVALDRKSEGNRVYGDAFYAPYDVLAGVRQMGDTGFRELSGESDMDQLLIHANVALNPSPALTFIVSGRLEKISKSGSSSFYETDLTTHPITFQQVGGEAIIVGSAADDFDEVTMRWELRYTGFKHLSLFLRATAYYGSGSIEEVAQRTKGYVIPSDVSGSTLIDWVDRKNDYEREGRKMATGFSWYVRRDLTLSGQYRWEVRENSYEPIYTYKKLFERLKYPNYISEHDWVLHRGFVRLKWVPRAGLSFNTHIDAEMRDLKTQSIDQPSVESGQMDSVTLGESFTCALSSKVSLQAFVSYTQFKLKTPASGITGNAAGVVNASNGGYVYGSLNVMYSFNDQNQLELSYSMLDSDDYVDNSNISVPYGNRLKENVVSIVYRRTVSEAVKWNIGFTFHSSKDDASNGYYDFEAQEIFMGLSKGF